MRDEQLHYNFHLSSILDEGGIRRRITFSSSQREVNATPLNARVPLSDLVTGQVCGYMIMFMR